MGKTKLNKETIDVYKRRIRFVCKNYGLKDEDIEDCTSWIFCTWLEGKSQKQTISHSVIDWLRIAFGSTRNMKTIHSKKFRTDNTISLEAMKEWRKPGKDTTVKQRDKSDAYRLCAMIPNERIRIIIALNIIWGISQRELAYIMGVNEARISQLYKKGVEYLSRVNDGDEDADRMFETMVDWPDDYDILDL